MHDLSHVPPRNTPTRTPAMRALAAALPARNRGAAKPAVLGGVIPPLANVAGLPVVAPMASSLPRASSPRIMNVVAVPLTDAERFTRCLHPSLA